MDRTWLITGCSTGFGRELALELIERGEQVVATARNPEAIADIVARAPDRVLGCRLDVTVQAQIDETVRAALDRFGRIDVLVNNAGYALVGGAEEVAPAEYRHLFDTNFFGLVAMTQAVLPAMRARRNGHIINISSMGGISGGLGMAFYGATKFALAGFSESLALDAGVLGIRVTIVEPGPHRTEALSQATFAAREISEYAETVGRFRSLVAKAARNEPGDARLAARAIITAADASHPPLHLPLGAEAIARLDRKIAALLADRDRWLQTSLSTTPIGQP